MNITHIARTVLSPLGCTGKSGRAGRPNLHSGRVREGDSPSTAVFRNRHKARIGDTTVDRIQHTLAPILFTGPGLSATWASVEKAKNDLAIARETVLGMKPCKAQHSMLNLLGAMNLRVEEEEVKLLSTPTAASSKTTALPTAFTATMCGSGTGNSTPEPFDLPHITRVEARTDPTMPRLQLADLVHALMRTQSRSHEIVNVLSNHAEHHLGLGGPQGARIVRLDHALAEAEHALDQALQYHAYKRGTTLLKTLMEIKTGIQKELALSTIIDEHSSDSEEWTPDPSEAGSVVGVSPMMHPGSVTVRWKDPIASWLEPTEGTAEQAPQEAERKRTSRTQTVDTRDWNRKIRTLQQR